jgi:ferredoxin
VHGDFFSLTHAQYFALFDYIQLLSPASSKMRVENTPAQPFNMATYQVKILHRGQTHVIEVPDDRTVLEVANKLGLDLPSSCTAGVCTTCAAQILSGTVDQTDGMGVSPELQQQGYALLCVTFPRSDLKIETEKEEIVYQLQFGQHQQQKK